MQRGQMADDNAIFARGKTFSRKVNLSLNLLNIKTLVYSCYNAWSFIIHCWLVLFHLKLSFLLLYPCLNTVFFTMVCILICSDDSDYASEKRILLVSENNYEVDGATRTDGWWLCHIRLRENALANFARTVFYRNIVGFIFLKSPRI